MAKNQFSLGSIAFLIGVLIAVISAFMTLPSVAVFISAIMAVIVALGNITMKETQKALWWAIGMLLAGGSGIAGYFTFQGLTFISTILANLGAFFSIIAIIFLIKFGFTLFKGK